MHEGKFINGERETKVFLVLMQLLKHCNVVELSLNKEEQVIIELKLKIED